MPDTLPPAVAADLAARLGTDRWVVSPLPSGAINQAARVDMWDNSLFVKWTADPPPGLFAAEADGLAVLRRVGALRIPQVIAASDDPAYLAIEFLPSAPPADVPAFTARFAEALAAQHRAAPDEPTFGYPIPNYLGLYPQANAPRTPDWPTFYRDCRLLPQIAMAREKNLLPPDRERLLMAVVERLETLLDGLPPEISLLHGDLWSGNFLCLPGDTPALIDPAVYYGPREMELGYIELFGGFPPGFADAYHAAWPLADGYPRRRPLHQLWHLLVHLNYFGERYGPPVERACHAALGG